MCLPALKRYLSVLGAAALIFAATGVTAAEPKKAEASPNETCLMCHGDPEAKSDDGKAIGVDKAKFVTSVHGQMHLKCTDCHTDVSLDKLPHAPKLKPVNCANCHEDQVKEYQSTVHGQAKAKGNVVAATCADCHGKHDILKSSNPASRTNIANIETTCGACHGNDAVVKKAHLPGGNIVSKYHDSLHGQLRNAKGGEKSGAPTCTSCHGTHNIFAKSDSRSEVARGHILDMCGACHQRVRATFDKSLHGQLSQSGMSAAPVCVDCHKPHQVQRHDATKFQVEVINECGNCHVEQMATYRDTFHGQVTQLGFTRVATCASCHGSHEILPPSNPASKVSAVNLVKTCQQCHKNANANFVQYAPHGNAHDREQYPLLFYTKKFMDWLLVGVFLFFGLHTVLWFVRSLRELRELRANRPGN